MTRWIALALLLAASGCRVFAGKQDYADYRAVRLAQGDEARLYALQNYAAQHPDGQWYSEVAIERSTREHETFERGKSTRAGLELYLKAYPDGTYAPQARSRLAAVELIERRKAEGAAQAQQLSAARKQREEELRRTWVTRFANYWTSTLLGLSAWGEPIPDVARKNAQFSRAFGAAPRPRCTADECVKYYTSRYAIPVPGGTRVERTLSMVLRLRMTDGKLQRAELLMPGHGFSRWFELEQRRSIAAGDAQGRTEAANWALASLKAGLGQTAELQPIAQYALGPIVPPSIGPSGELIDTSAEDPSEPPKQLSGMDAPGSAADARQAGAAPDVEALVKPKADGQAPDMVFAPVGVTREGRTYEVAPESAPSDPHAGGGDVMVMDAMAVPKADGTSAPPAAASAPAPTGAAAEPIATESPASVSAFNVRGFRVVLFAAAGGATAPAYDGVIIERASAAAPTQAKQGKPKQPPAQLPAGAANTAPPPSTATGAARPGTLGTAPSSAPAAAPGAPASAGAAAASR